MCWQLTQLRCFASKQRQEMLCLKTKMPVYVVHLFSCFLFSSNLTEWTGMLRLISTTPWWPRNPTNNSIHTHKHTMRIIVTCLLTLKSMGLTAFRHPHPSPPSQIKWKNTMREGVRKAMMMLEDLFLTTSLDQITIQMMATMTLAKQHHCTLHPEVKVDIVPLRNTPSGMPVHRTIPRRDSRRMWY